MAIMTSTKSHVNHVSQYEEEFAKLDLLSPEDHQDREKALVRRIDLRLMPMLVLMIVMNYLDRNALANARIQGIEKSLKLHGNQFNTAISVLFAGYIALQIPSNILLTRARPSVYLSSCMIVWGVVSGLTSVVHNFTGLVLVRFFLGVVEAPYFPGALFLLSSWYTREELALRMSILYTGSLLAGGFGGLIGAGVQAGLNGVRGLESWRWLFIIESSITVVIAAASLFILPDFPHTTSFLSKEEKALAVRRLQISSGSLDTERGSLLAGIKMAVLDYKVWLLALIIVMKTSAGAVTSFIPTLVATFNFSAVHTLLLVAPPYVFAAACALTISYRSDKTGERCFHIIVPIFFAMAGYIIAAASTNLGARYFSIFLMLGGVYGSYNVALAWISSTLPRPIEKRSAAIAIVNVVGNFAQIYSPYMYPKSDGPRYITAMAANALRYCLTKENQKLDLLEQIVVVDKPKGDRIEIVEEAAGGVLVLNPGFRYIL